MYTSLSLGSSGGHGDPHPARPEGSPSQLNRRYPFQLQVGGRTKAARREISGDEQTAPGSTPGENPFSGIDSYSEKELELFSLVVEFHRRLESCPKTWRKQVLAMIKSMAKSSYRDYKNRCCYEDDCVEVVIKV